MPEPAVLLEIRAGVAHLTLNRPDTQNAINVEMARSLQEATGELAGKAGVRAVLLTGVGTRFCAGGDVKAFAAAGDGLAPAIGEILGALHPAVANLAGLEAPVVAAVRGSAAGAGMALVAGADLVLAAASAKFVLAYTAIGLVPDGGSSWYLPRVVGTRRALELALMNRPLTADEACAWGLVTQVVPDDSLNVDAEALAARLAAGPTRAFGGAKRLIRASLANDLEHQLDQEAAAMLAAAGSADAREGVTAFVEKRPPEFRGA